MATDAVAGRAFAALAQPVRLIEGEPEEARSLAGGDQPEPVVARWQVLRHGLPLVDPSLRRCRHRSTLSSDVPARPVDNAAPPTAVDALNGRHRLITRERDRPRSGCSSTKQFRSMWTMR